MTRIALLSDVHADVHALADALIQAERLGCERIVCAGDLVDYGSYPDETLALLAARAIPCVRGNHDRGAALPERWDAVIDGVRVAVRHGTPDSNAEGVYPGRASAAEVERWLAQAQADVLIVGHTHLPFVIGTVAGGMIANPGALLRAPAGRMPQTLVYDVARGTYELVSLPCGGTFGVLELPERSFKVCRASDGVELEIPRLSA